MPNEYTEAFFHVCLCPASIFLHIVQPSIFGPISRF